MKLRSLLASVTLLMFGVTACAPEVFAQSKKQNADSDV